MNIINKKIGEIKPYQRNAKKHDKKQVQNVAESIKQFGFAQPLVIDKDNNLIIGHCRLSAAKKLKLKEVPCVMMESLTKEQADKLRLLDNKLNESEWDMDLLSQDIPELDFSGFDIDWGLKENWFEREKEGEARQEGNEEYNEFLDKFETKKTTDDCYTPDNIYDAVADWVANEFRLNRKDFIRPFYPNGDYQKENYDNRIVVDNPPFSILAEIMRWYTERNIRFFLFAPSLTIITAMDCDLTYITVGAQITYENGANVSTGFITNMDKENRLRTAPDLWEAIKEQNDINLREKAKELPNYCFPDEVICPAQIMKIAHYGQDLRIKKADCVVITALDEMKAEGKVIYGRGMLLSKKAAAEKAAAEKAAARKWRLSDRELKIVKELGK